jgi:hypothetical protein
MLGLFLTYVLYNPHYYFNDEILPIGAAFWVSLVKTVLAV